MTLDTYDLRNQQRRTFTKPLEGGEEAGFDLFGLRPVKAAPEWQRRRYGPSACPFVRVAVHVRQGDGMTHADCAVWSHEGLYSRSYETRPSQTTATASYRHRDRAERWAIQFARSVGAQRLIIETYA